MGLDFTKLGSAIDEALAPTVVEKKMTAEEFGAYAKEQFELAKAESEEDGRARLTALKEQVEIVTKFEYKPGELPAVKFFKAKDQQRPGGSGEQAPEFQALGGPGMGWTAKASSGAEALGKLLGEFLSTGAAEPAKPGEVAPNTPAPAKADPEVAWPKDLTLDLD